ncbi:cytochrome c [Cribrihabitans marinus]|uniref:cytochrome c n=1 Tax=Cribrihabitans marinus TaxID=1227549 RepID=UPI003CC80309
MKARMHAMDVIGDKTRQLGAMARGRSAFDAATAQAAAVGIAEQAPSRHGSRRPRPTRSPRHCRPSGTTSTTERARQSHWRRPRRLRTSPRRTI